ncbi:MAG: riboflavin synthase [Bacteroidales bacterium]|nr:riboflavin synthase [Bacteroidales bacterium]HOY38374.1 riboflavin synthase [Bacteroidales bacterium]HQP04437.1 riboflavin synthase [Bacteroidales bacterium]
MFSGIVEETAKIVKIEQEQSNYHFYLTCSFAGDLHLDQSVSHNGVCLTVVEVNKSDKVYKVTAIQETIDKSNLGLLSVGDEVNVERSMTMDRLLDGHMVQGHVDQTAECIEVAEADGSWYYTFRYDSSKGNITVEKGSVSVNGVSLTVVNSKNDRFSVAIIPYTWQITNFHNIKAGTIVNLEFDIIGKYIQKIMAGYLENFKK